MNPEKINLQQSRDFGETFSVSVKLLRQNFKIFFQCMLFIAGPFILLSAIAGAFYQANSLTLSPMNSFSDPMSIFRQFGLAWVILVVTATIANLVMLGTVFSFMVIYQEKGPGNFTVNDVGRKLIENTGNIILIFLLTFIVSAVVIGIIAAIVIGIGVAVPALGILLGFLFIIGLLLVGPPIYWLISVVYLVNIKEGKNIPESFGKAKEVMRGNFWWTWVIVVCGSIAIGIMGFVFALPQAAYQMVLVFTNMGGTVQEEVSIPFMIVATLCTFCVTLIQSIMHILNGIHYYSLDEQKNGQGLMERINEIGNTQNQNVEQQY
jgi:hypothetical protein